MHRAIVSFTQPLRDRLTLRRDIGTRRGIAGLILRYTVAVLSAAAAFGLAMTLQHPWVTLSPFFLFYAAVAVSSWYGGTGPGVVATVIGAIAADYYLLAPRGSLSVQHPQDVARLVLFALVGALIAILNGALRVALTERKRAEAEIKLHQERLQAMASELMMAEERERRRIATVLHDAVVQTLALSKFKVDGMRRTTQNGLHDRLSEVYDLIDKSISHTRTLTADLSPPVLYELGLPAAIQWLGDRLRADHGLSFELAASKDWQPLDEQKRVVLFQAVRELLVNVGKHAQATRCRVTLRREGGREGDAVRVDVHDNGRGFTTPARTNYGNGGLGLFNIRQRLDHLGGSLTLNSHPGRGGSGGTTVSLVLPLAHVSKEGIAS